MVKVGDFGRVSYDGSIGEDFYGLTAPRNGALVREKKEEARIREEREAEETLQKTLIETPRKGQRADVCSVWLCPSVLGVLVGVSTAICLALVKNYSKRRHSARGLRHFGHFHRYLGMVAVQSQIF